MLADSPDHRHSVVAIAGEDAAHSRILHGLADQSPALIAICNPAGEYLYANGAFAAALGLPPEALPGRNEARVLRETGAPDALRVGPPAQISQREVDVRIDSGARRFLISRFPILGNQGTPIAAGMIATDLPPLEVEPDEDGKQRHAELLQALEKMERLAYTDRLTGAWNRRHLEDSALLEMSRAERHGHPVSLLVLDVDHFKEINDQFGHAVGDYVLVELVRCLRTSLRRTDTITRWGGEEFVVLAADTPLHEAEQLAHKLCARVAEVPLSSARHITISIGVAEYQSGESFEHWFERADQAMFRAKADGRNRIVADPATTFGGAERGLAAPVQLVWRNSYCSGNAVVDREHRELFEHANRLLQDIVTHAPRTRIIEGAQRLLQDIGAHFASEEALHQEIGYPARDAHAAEHARLLDMAGQLFARTANEAMPAGEVFHFLAYDVIAQHLLGADRHYFPYLASPDTPAAN